MAADDEMAAIISLREPAALLTGVYYLPLQRRFGRYAAAHASSSMYPYLPLPASLRVEAMSARRSASTAAGVAYVATRQ